MFQSVYMTDGNYRSRVVKIRSDDLSHLRAKCVRVAREWRSRIVIVTTKPGNPAIPIGDGKYARTTLVRLSDSELGDRRPVRK